jgi:hypothetical protein
MENGQIIIDKVIKSKNAPYAISVMEWIEKGQRFQKVFKWEIGKKRLGKTIMYGISPMETRTYNTESIIEAAKVSLWHF